MYRAARRFDGGGGAAAVAGAGTSSDVGVLLIRYNRLPRYNRKLWIEVGMRSVAYPPV